MSDFDDVRDAQGILKSEKRLVAILYRMNAIQFILIIILIIGMFTLFPLKKNIPYLVRFSNASQNFAEVARLNEDLKEDMQIRSSLAIAYVLNAETKNNIDDKERQNIVRLQSSFKVWKKFKDLYTTDKSIFANKFLEREINIITINLIPDTNIAQIDFQAILTKGEKVLNTSNFRAVFKFGFEKIKLKYNEIGLNPTSYKVTSYSISKIGEE